MIKFRVPVSPIRDGIRRLQADIESDPYFKDVSSINKKKADRGFYFHATDDPPEVRERFYKFIQTLDLSFEAVVGRKIPSLYMNKHNSKESEFYADLLSHLLKNKFELGEDLVLNVAQRGNVTRNENLQRALIKATTRFLHKKPEGEIKTRVVFNVQNHITEPLLNVADYLCWSVQRVFEKGETRYYNFIEEKISVVVDLYDSEKYVGNKNYYTRRNKLTAANKLSPPSY